MSRCHEVSFDHHSPLSQLGRYSNENDRVMDGSPYGFELMGKTSRVGKPSHVRLWCRSQTERGPGRSTPLVPR
jgi:hypothetical protein